MKPLFWIVLTICVSATAAERVASLSPNLTETVVRLGAEDQLVGRSSACDYPESVRKLPVVGRFGVPALEPLLATRPTLVIAETLRNDADAERLRELGVRLEAFPAVTLDDYFRNVVGTDTPEHPILIDKFLEHAVEVDVDALSDGKEVYVAGIMEHIEEAGIHSGDSACVLPSFSLSYDHVALIAAQAEALARELKVVGLMNIQFAIKGDDLYILEVNPRASRTAPFVSKATGVPLPYMATQVMLGKTLDELDPWSMRRGGFTCVKEAVLPFQRFPGVDIILGPEMHSTGEVMGMGSDFPEAYYKSQLASGQDLPQGGNVFISVNDRDKPILPEVAAMFADLGFHLLATRGTARYLRERGLEVEEVLKVYEGRPNIVDRMINGDVALVINTASGKNTARDSKSIRHTAVSYGVPYCTTVAGAKASAIAIGKRREDTHVESLQEYYAREARG